MSLLPKYNRKRFLSLYWIVPFLASCNPLRAFSKQSQNKLKRRVVTGVNANGKSSIISDGFVPKNATYSDPGHLEINTLWVENQVPVAFDKQAETLDGYAFTLEPSYGGFKAYFITFEPGYKPDFHKTDTIDFIFIISGKLELLVEGGSTILASGDSVVQRGTNHAWRVVGDEPCKAAAVVISAKKG
ncbi:cupin domain-containing protein [Nibrella saemangeumensis]|uniref:Cupin domain-containing protein n=1 Tax=Nibrella saemangeumensis TaxID=1084526 RepID=A0ABP8MHQ3_9BACT